MMKFSRYFSFVCILAIVGVFALGCEKMEKPVMDAMDMAMTETPTETPAEMDDTETPTEMDDTDTETPADPMVEDDVDTATTFTIAAGSTFTLDVNVENTQNLAGFAFNSISFSPNVLEAIEVTHSDFFKSDELEAEITSTEIDNEAGEITTVGAGTKTQDGVSASGTLFSITFLPKASGETQLTFIGGLAVSSTGVITGIVQPNVRIVVQEDPTPDQVLDEQASIVLSW